MSAPPRTRAGFSLIELMIAVAILSIGMVTVITVILNSLELERQSKELTIAKNAAELQMQQLRGTDYVDLLTMMGATATFANNFQVNGLMPAAGDSDGDPNQCGWFQLQKRSGAFNENLMDITVRIQWRQKSTGTRTYELTSMRSDRGARFTPTGP